MIFRQTCTFLIAKSGKLAHFDIKEEIEAYKRNTQKQRKSGKTTVNC